MDPVKVVDRLDVGVGHHLGVRLDDVGVALHVARVEVGPPDADVGRLGDGHAGVAAVAAPCHGHDEWLVAARLVDPDRRQQQPELQVVLRKAIGRLGRRERLHEEDAVEAAHGGLEAELATASVVRLLGCLGWHDRGPYDAARVERFSCGWRRRCRRGALRACHLHGRDATGVRGGRSRLLVVVVELDDHAVGRSRVVLREGGLWWLLRWQRRRAQRVVDAGGRTHRRRGQLCEALGLGLGLGAGRWPSIWCGGLLVHGGVGARVGGGDRGRPCVARKRHDTHERQRRGRGHRGHLEARA